MSYEAVFPEKYKGKIAGSGHCVAFVRACTTAPPTALWREGSKVKDNAAVPKGTAIATFQGGQYQNQTSGDSHAAIYLHQDGAGIYVYDQWLGHPVSERCIRFKGGLGTPNNDGDAFSIIE